jgi:glycosyltransferase involved in cell wall biosynthesis
VGVGPVTGPGPGPTGAQPWISVIIPVYDGAQFIADAIDSVLGQDAGRFEIITVDDCSPDGSTQVASSRRAAIEAAGHRLITLRRQVNGGVAAARNDGLRAATSGLVAFLDQDDLWPAGRTAALLAAMGQHRAAVAIGRMSFTVITTGDRAPGSAQPWARQEWFQGDHRGLALGAMLLERAVLDEVGLLDETIAGGFDDVDWIMRLRHSGVTTVEVAEQALQRRIHTRNQSRVSAKHSDALLATVRAHLQRTRDGAR